MKQFLRKITVISKFWESDDGSDSDFGQLEKKR